MSPTKTTKMVKTTATKPPLAPPPKATTPRAGSPPPKPETPMIKVDAINNEPQPQPVCDKEWNKYDVSSTNMRENRDCKLLLDIDCALIIAQ